MRKHVFTNGEFYHIFNRGVDKRTIFLDRTDFERFLESMNIFNSVSPIGSLYEHSFAKNKLGGRTPKSLVNIICYCLNPNHYHLILEQLTSGGISEFIKRVSGGYTSYFNIKHKRSGVLFQGKFKSVHIQSNTHLLHTSAYVNLNNRVHRLQKAQVFSSWREYENQRDGNLCKRNIILDQFKNFSEYKEFAESSLQDILERKESAREFDNLLE
jgi:REP element-mobilizing transposase RayT